MIPLMSGKIGMANVDRIERGEKGKPGEAKGKLGFDTPIGRVDRNTEFGIFGVITEGVIAGSGSTMEICPLQQLRCGPAQILSDIAGKADLIGMPMVAVERFRAVGCDLKALAA